MIFKSLQNFFSRSKRISGYEIDPDEIFLDSRNLPDFDTDQFEGRLEHPISSSVFRIVSIVFVVIVMVLGGRLWFLQVHMGEAYEIRSENNHLRHTTIFSSRGVVYDRNRSEIAWDELNPGSDFSLRKYTLMSGAAHLIGYVKYPSKDKSGFYYSEAFIGKDGVEESYNTELTGINGLKITETDALGNVESESVLTPPKDGSDLTLSVDLEVQHTLFEAIKTTAQERGFSGGAGVIMDVHNGEILAITSYPEYDPNVMTDGSNSKQIQNFLTDKNNPFLDRAISGLYIPGSIMKPFIAMGVLEEGIIDPRKQIESVGSISIPNPYNPEKKTIFRDWKIHGWVDMRKALAVSSDEYFYTVGGGYAGQKGIGIDNIEKYVKMFGFGTTTGINLSGEKKGNVPSQAWKAETFDGEAWRLGDTYNSSIGQYGFQVTPIQAVRGVATYANGGTLVTPTVLLNDPRVNKKLTTLPFSQDHFQIVREGMRMAVTEGSTGALLTPAVAIAAKTGTAELGITKENVNSWVTGFFPYENPRFAFAILMEKGSRHNLVGAVSVMRQLVDWMAIYKPEYLQ